MIKNPSLLKKFEEDFIRGEGVPDYNRSLRLFTDMWNEGVMLGVLPPKDPLDGIDVDIRIAKTLNSCLKKSSRG
ncbi:MAG TPA: hypothetical protein VI914_08030 [Thermodesulfobacteriota bacterium]|nr:hypothetical protein [Thermodesulfobacteriota bacterium]